MQGASVTPGEEPSMRTMATRKELQNAMLLSRLDDLERLAARLCVERHHRVETCKGKEKK